MRFLITGDLHLDEKRPKNRKEGYIQEQRDKMRQIMEMAKEHEVDAILQPGDFFNTSKLSDGSKTFWIEFFKYWGIPIYTVPGQHDMRYHSSNIENTPLGVLNAAGVITIIGNPPYGMKWNSPMSDRNVFLYGSGWEQEIMGIQDKSAINILLLHMLLSDSPLYPGHQHVQPGWILNKNDFDLIVSGDNHKNFIRTEDGPKHIVNCGSLMRSSIDQAEHHPSVCIYDTEDKSLRELLLHIKPFEEVMNLEEAQKEKRINQELENFVEGLSDSNIQGLDYKKNLIEHLRQNKNTIGQGVVDIINEIMNEI